MRVFRWFERKAQMTTDSMVLCFSLTEFQNSEHVVQKAFVLYSEKTNGKNGRQFRVRFEYM